jgi:hypothetical protein
VGVRCGLNMPPAPRQLTIRRPFAEAGWTMRPVGVRFLRHLVADIGIEVATGHG